MTLKKFNEWNDQFNLVLKNWNTLAYSKLYFYFKKDKNFKNIENFDDWYFDFIDLIYSNSLIFNEWFIRYENVDENLFIKMQNVQYILYKIGLKKLFLDKEFNLSFGDQTKSKKELGFDGFDFENQDGKFSTETILQNKNNIKENLSNFDNDKFIEILKPYFDWIKNELLFWGENEN